MFYLKLTRNLILFSASLIKIINMHIVTELTRSDINNIENLVPLIKNDVYIMLLNKLC